MKHATMTRLSMSIRLIGILLLLLLTSCTDQNAEANKVLVEATKVIDQAKDQPPATKVSMLKKAETMLASIVSKYPASSVAVQLSTGQSVGNVSLAALRTRIEAEEVNAARFECPERPTRACLFKDVLKDAAAGGRGMVSELLADWTIDVASSDRSDGLSMLPYVEQVSQLLKGTDKHQQTLRALLLLRAKSGQTGAAVALLEQLGLDNVPPYELATVGMALSRAGETAFARRIDEAVKNSLSQVANAESRANLARAILAAVSRAGTAPIAEWAFNASFAATMEIVDLKTRGRLLRLLVEPAAKAGMQGAVAKCTEAAKSAAGTLATARERSFELWFITQALGRGGSLQDAEDLIPGIESAPIRIAAVRDISVAKMARGDPDGARASFERALAESDNLVGADERVAALLPLAKAMAEAKFDELARTTLARTWKSVEFTRGASDRTKVFLQVAQGYVNAGYSAEAVPILELATIAAQSIPDPRSRNSELWLSALRAGKIGQFPLAMTAIESMSEPVVTHQSYFQLAESSATFGKTSEAQSWILRARSYFRDSMPSHVRENEFGALVALAFAYAKSGQPMKTGEVVSQLLALGKQFDPQRYSALVARAVQPLSEAGLRADVRNALESAETKEELLEGLGHVAQALISAGRLRDAFLLCEEIRTIGAISTEHRIAFVLYVSTLFP